MGRGRGEGGEGHGSDIGIDLCVVLGLEWCGPGNIASSRGCRKGEVTFG